MSDVTTTPHSLEAERAVVGAVLITADRLMKLVILNRVISSARRIATTSLHSYGYAKPASQSIR